MAVIEVIQVNDVAIELIVDSCEGEPKLKNLELGEDGRAVTVTVESDPRSNNECLDLLVITLPDGANPVVLIDDTSGNQFRLRSQRSRSGPQSTRE